MKIGDKTLEILRNFAEINPKISINKGQLIKSISAEQNVFGDAQVKEKFPVDFAIYDLSEFLRAVGLFEEPEFDFQEDFVVISGDGNSVRYFYGNRQNIYIPKKEFKMPPTEIELDISQGTWESLKRAAAVLHIYHLSLLGDGKNLSYFLHDAAIVSSANTYTIDDLAKSKIVCEMTVKIDSVNLIPGDYKVKISGPDKVMRIDVEGRDVSYTVGMEPDSSFEG